MKCEVCGSLDTKLSIDLGDQPLCDDLIPLGASQTCNRYPLKIWHCKNCDTGLQEINVDKKTLFPRDYHYRARNTPSVLTSMEKLVSQVNRDYFQSLEGIKVLDVGCNDGSLLQFFASKGAKTYGIDPTDAIKDAKDVDQTWQEFFTPYSAIMIKECIGYPDIITFTNCFAHIENMSELMTALSALMGPDTLVIIENHYFRSVIEKNQFDTFYHEHPRTYSAKSFKQISQLLAANLIKLETTDRYGGNIRAFITRSLNTKFKVDKVLEDEFDYASGLLQMSEFIPIWKAKKIKQIKEVVNQIGEPLVGIAFPGRASILVNLLGLTEKELSATYEIRGSLKTGTYIPGTRIPILPEKQLFDNSEKPSVILNLAWHIEDDVRKNLENYNYNPKIINIL